MTRLYFFTIAVLLGMVCNGQPKKVDNHLSFVPPGYSILDSAVGNLNKDVYPDMVMILRNDAEQINPDTSRPVLLLAGTANGSYKLLDRCDHVVLCAGCGGMMGDPYQAIAIKNGFFSIEHYGGSGWRWTKIITFRYDPITSTFKLHRDAGVSYHATDPNKQTQVVHNKKYYGKLTFSKYSYEAYE